MLELLIAASFIALLVLASVGAERRFSGQERLPMQWSLTGKVNWTAPRRMALALTPVLAALVLGGTVIALLSTDAASPGRKPPGVAVLLFVGSGFLASHLLHLWLIQRTVR